MINGSNQNKICKKNYTLHIGKAAILWQLVETCCLNMTILEKKSLKFGNFGAIFFKKYLCMSCNGFYFCCQVTKQSVKTKKIDNMSSKHSFTLQNLMK